MAFKFSTSNLLSNRNQTWDNLVQTMIEASWSCLAWSDGTTAHITGTIPGPYSTGPGSPDPIFPATGVFPSGTGAGTGAWGNTRAWVLMRQPQGSGSIGNHLGDASGRTLVFQRGTTNEVWRFTYSKAGHSKDAATSQNAPNASDKRFIRGGGTEASPTFEDVFAGTAGIERSHCAVDDGINNDVNPFAFYSINIASGGGTLNNYFVFDSIQNGTFLGQDLDPFVMNCDANDFASNSFWDTNVRAPKTWLKYGFSDATFTRVSPCKYYSMFANGARQASPAHAASHGTGTNPINGFDDFLPIPYMRDVNNSNLTGFKGVGSLYLWTSTQRSNGDTFTLSTNRDKIYWGGAIWPWDGTVPIL
jgi:hypothetical protein